MKKAIYIFLILSLFFSTSYAYATTEEVVNEVIQPVVQEEQIQTITTKAKVIERNEFMTKK